MSQPQLEIIPAGYSFGVMMQLPAAEMLALWEAHADRVLELTWHFAPECDQAIQAVDLLNSILDENPEASVHMVTPTRGGGIAQ